jgi:hypothetical protein
LFSLTAASLAGEIRPLLTPSAFTRSITLEPDLMVSVVIHNAELWILIFVYIFNIHIWGAFQKYVTLTMLQMLFCQRLATLPY